MTDVLIEIMRGMPKVTEIMTGMVDVRTYIDLKTWTNDWNIWNGWKNWKKRLERHIMTGIIEIISEKKWNN